MSRFFGAAGESASASEESDQDIAQTGVEATKFVAYESSSEDEDKRVVRTEKDKRYDELKNTIKAMRSNMRNDAWNEVADLYETWKKQLEKSKKVFKKEGGTPDFVLIQWAYMKKCVEEKRQLAKEGKGAKLSKTASVSLNKIGQRVGKEIKPFAKDIEELEESGGLDLPEEKAVQDFDDEDEEGEGEGEGEDDYGDDGEGDQGQRDGEGWSDGEYDEGDGSSSDSSDVNLEGPVGITRDFWVKKVVEKKKKTPEEAEEERRKREIRAREREARKKKKAEIETKKSEMTAEAVLKKLRDIEDRRGRKGVDRSEYIEDLELLLTKAKQQATRLKIQTLIATAIFDMNLNTGKSMSAERWKECAKIIDDILDALLNNSNLRLGEDEEIEENYEELELEDDEEIKKAEEKEKKGDGIIFVKGNMHSFVSRLSSQFSSSLHDADEHDASYVARLMDERELVAVIEKTEIYYTKLKKYKLLNLVKLLHLNHVYYIYDPKNDYFAKKMEDDKGYRMKVRPMFSERKGDTVYNLATSLYLAEGARMKTIARLSHVYNYCIHNRFGEARNLLLMSHLQDCIDNADVEVRILYNRTVAQLGLCAFRNGHYGASLDCLSRLYDHSSHSTRIKELLAQGVSSNRYHERNHEKERLERMREYPYHMHMNLDMLEAVNLVSAMFAEIPNLAKHGKRKKISHAFRKYYDPYKKQEVTAPPESTRQIIMAASDALSNGDWLECYNHISNLRMWAIMPHSDEVKGNLKKQIQASALQMYLLMNGSTYVSIKSSFLCEMFSLTESSVHKVVSRMMLRNELLGAWDQPSGSIVMHNEDQSRLQQQTAALADKVAQHVEMNERLLDLRGSYYKQDYNRGKDSKSHNQDRRGHHHHHHHHHHNYHNRPKTYSRKGQMSRTSRY